MKVNSRSAVAAVITLLLASLAVGPAANAAPVATDSFYRYSGSAPLSSFVPGTVLKTRTVPYHVLGLPLPLQAVQLLYRSTGSLGQPTANVTSVVKPPVAPATPKAVSYQSFYDSLNPADGPSRAIAGDFRIPGLIANFESVFLVPWLSQGYTVLFPDTEGQSADFAAGPEYGMNTLDSIRAASTSPDTGLTPSAKVGAVGYSGGAIATGWAAQLAPSYAPDVNRNLVGAAEGGVLANPRKNLDYVDGTPVWGGVIAMALIGASRAYGIDLAPYLSDQGLALHHRLQNASIIEALPQTSGLTWQELVKPQYASSPDTIPVFVDTVKKITMLGAPSPTVPMLIGQGANGLLEGTPGTRPGIGAGDGVMVTADVRALARQFCAEGTPVRYDQYDLLSHVGTAAAWFPLALSWLDSRFAARTAPDTCAQIPR
ncbi:lipase family protein [Amycolatopsis sp. PS_44_ISF1]|uniref:lipase family protein n=1 Tax=Amycolatopsis sp. PS_44_ISF1 TaxID=2974917 RepID=UPI0028E05C61|nr:lipase family protein [Amycolatopsis sp. PS_44_ISF1]MDT8913170.1 triacylglycerol lipase [Amycolatopsis sp. PS_44_ISF1]